MILSHAAIGRYRLESVEGVGAFATVWRGYDDELDVPVAIKVLADNWSHHDEVRARFLEEARILRGIRNPRIVRVHDIGVPDGRPHFVMDFLAGVTPFEHPATRAEGDDSRRPVSTKASTKSYAEQPPSNRPTATQP